MLSQARCAHFPQQAAAATSLQPYQCWYGCLLVAAAACSQHQTLTILQRGHIGSHGMRLGNRGTD
eukprot:366089-Chlamydomonas_euryale.AAC.3